MNKLQTLVTVLAISFGIAFFGGMFSWYLDEGFLMVLGLIDVVCIIWLLAIVYGKDSK